MKDRKLLSVQDISCVGQCSLTVALPIISACGVETAVLPSAVLSTHTGWGKGYTFRDLTDDIEGIVAHWEQAKIDFDAIYTGYLGSLRQIELVRDLFRRVTAPGGLKIVDPAMGDDGKLYIGFDRNFAHEMGKLCGDADVALPNITEACMMTDEPFMESGYDEAYIRRLLDKVLALGAKTAVLTGVSYEEGRIGVAVLTKGDREISYYFHERLPRSCHGTGDVFASAFAGAVMRERTPIEAAKIAADFTVASMKATADDESHWYGVKFEKAIPSLIAALNK